MTTLADRRIAGLAVQRTRHLDKRDTTRYRRIPVTTVARTLVDLAAELPLDPLTRVCHEAQVRHRIARAMVYASLTRRTKAPGGSKLREIFEGQVTVTLSKLERDFLRLLRSEGLPAPQTNRRADRGYVDCRWPDRRLTVELDSYRYHHTRHAWEQDRRREREVRAGGNEFRRYTYGDVTGDQTLMLAELRGLLGTTDQAHAVTRRQSPRQRP